MKVKDKKDVLKVLETNRGVLFGFGVKKVGVFGSFARGEQTEKSDIDLLVEFIDGKKTYKNYMKVADLTEALLGRDVDIVTLQSLSPYLAPHIQKEVNYVQIA
jgi:uncharacterized protein